MKRLLVINQFASAPKYSTGAGERFYYLASEFKKQGWKTTVISSAYNHLFLRYPETKALFTQEVFSDSSFLWIKIRKYRAESSLGRIIAFFDFLLKLFLFPIKKHGLPDLVIVSSMSIFPVFYAVYLKWRYRIPFVLEIRDIWPLTPIELGGYSPKHPFIRLLQFTANLGYRKADHIVSVLPGFEKFLKSISTPYKAFTWIPNGIPQSLGITDQNPKNDEDRENFIVCYTGAIGTANAMEFLIEAAKLLNNDAIKIWIVGNGPEKERLVRMSEKLDTVRFFDKIPKEEVQRFLAQANCCYIGWRKKNIYTYGVSANKYNDYMLAEKPILSSSDIPDDPVALSKSGRQVEAENPEDIANGILYLYNLSPQQRKVLGNNGKQYLELNTTYSVLGKKYIEVLTKVGYKNNIFSLKEFAE